METFITASQTLIKAITPSHEAKFRFSLVAYFPQVEQGVAHLRDFYCYVADKRTAPDHNYPYKVTFEGVLHVLVAYPLENRDVGALQELIFEDDNLIQAALTCATVSMASTTTGLRRRFPLDAQIQMDPSRNMLLLDRMFDLSWEVV